MKMKKDQYKEIMTILKKRNNILVDLDMLSLETISPLFKYRRQKKVQDIISRNTQGIILFKKTTNLIDYILYEEIFLNTILNVYKNNFVQEVSKDYYLIIGQTGPVIKFEYGKLLKNQFEENLKEEKGTIQQKPLFKTEKYKKNEKRILAKLRREITKKFKEDPLCEDLEAHVNLLLPNKQLVIVPFEKDEIVTTLSKYSF